MTERCQLSRARGWHLSHFLFCYCNKHPGKSNWIEIGFIQTHSSRTAFPYNRELTAAGSWSSWTFGHACGGLSWLRYLRWQSLFTMDSAMSGILGCVNGERQLNSSKHLLTSALDYECDVKDPAHHSYTGRSLWLILSKFLLTTERALPLTYL